METSKKRLRRDYAPLNVSVGITCASPSSPVMQVYNGMTGTYEPDRSLTATVLMPVVHADANDGSLAKALRNGSVANVKWFVNNVDITTIEEWKDLYAIKLGTDDDERGALCVYRNVEPGETLTFRFEGQIYDARLGVTINLRSTEMAMATIDKGMDEFSINTDAPTNMVYDPFLDKLLAYDYQVAHGETDASGAAKAAATDGNAYLRTVGIHLLRGSKPYAGGDVTLRLCRATGVSNGSVTLEEVDTDDPTCEVLEFAADHMTLDLRMAEKADYVIIATYNGQEVARTQFAMYRTAPVYRVEVGNGADFTAKTTMHYNEAMVSSHGKVISCPSAVLDIVWKTDTANAAAMTHNEGRTTAIDLAKAGVGDTYADNWMDVYVETRQRGAFSVASTTADDGSEVVLTDESGQVLIFQ